MPREFYSPEDIERALLEVAMNGGYFKTASDSIKKKSEELGLERAPSREAIRKWVTDTYRDRYEEIRAEIAPKIRAQIAEENVGLARRYAQAEHTALDKVLEAVDQDKLDAKDLVNLSRNLATSKGIAVDKYDRVSEGGPSSGATRDLRAIMAGLAALGLATRPEADYEGEAVEESTPEIEA